MVKKVWLAVNDFLLTFASQSILQSS